MATAKGSNVDHHQETQKLWLDVFRECYNPSIVMQDLKDLKRLFVIEIYIYFTKKTLDANMDAITMPGQNVEGMRRYPDSYASSMVYPRVAKLLSWFFHSYYDDSSFTFGDFSNPNPARTRVFFEYIVDFIYKYHDFKNRIEEINEEIDIRSQRMTEMRNRLQGSRESTKQHNAEDLVQEEQERKRSESIEPKMKERQELKADLQTKIEAKQSAIKELKNQTNEIKLQATNVLEEQDRLRSAVVTEEELSVIQGDMQRSQHLREDISHKMILVQQLETKQRCTERMSKLVMDKLLPDAEELKSQPDQIAEIRDTSGEKQRMSRAAHTSEEHDHVLSLLRQRLAEHGDERGHLVDAWMHRKQGIETNAHRDKDICEQLRKLVEEQKGTELTLDEELHTSHKKLHEIQLDNNALQKHLDSCYTYICQGLERRNAKTVRDCQQLTELIMDADNQIN